MDGIYNNTTNSPSLLIGTLTDLWRYRISDSTWTWVSGLEFVNQPGHYGYQGVPDINNYPGSRRFAVGGFDSVNKELWLYGGEGYATDFPNGTQKPFVLGDLHQSDPTNHPKQGEL